MECSLCGNKKTKHFLETKDFAYTKESFRLRKCERCELIETHPKPTDIEKYYDFKNYDSYGQKKSFFGIVYSFVQNINSNYKLSLLKKNKLTLDYGSGSGHFVNFARKNGYEIYGYEPINKTSNNLIYDNVSEIQNKKFDQITMWHVLEHTKNPKALLKRIKRMINKDGELFVALPNLDSYDNTYYGKYWAGYDAPRHLHHFNRNSFSFMCQRVGFEIIKTKPLYFDSFYVSMLSEKNKERFFWPISGFIIGLISNILSFFTKKHSSIIYIIK